MIFVADNIDEYFQNLIDEKIIMYKEQANKINLARRICNMREKLKMTMHRCLICKNAVRFCDMPISMITGRNLSLTFECIATKETDAYGHTVDSNTMVYFLINGVCFVDGGVNIPVTRCSNYSLRKEVNCEVDPF